MLTRRFLAISLVFILACGALFAATAPPKNTNNHATLGTTQLKSDYNNPKFGQTFTLGKAAPINITVHGAEYTVAPQRIGNTTHVVNANEKFMVVHYTLHNPNKTDYGLRWSTLEILAVDANDQNWRFIGDVGIEGSGDSCNMSLKPGQKTKLYTIIRMPAKGAIPKLMFQSRDKLVLRYQLLQKDAKGNYINPVKPLPAPIADPADETGATALEVVPAQLGAYYPLRDVGAKVESITLSDDPIQGRAPSKGQRYLVAIVTARNDSGGKFGWAWSTIKATLTDQDGGDIRWNGTCLFASRDDDARADLAPGQELRVRYFFPVPPNLPLKAFGIQQSSTGRVYAYDLTNLK